MDNDLAECHWFVRKERLEGTLFEKVSLLSSYFWPYIIK